jgi:dihydroorotate dehydrogenase electron transfer subunit
MEPGEINVVGPTGNGFTMEENKKLLLAGGGVGNAPLYYLMKELKKRGNRITYIYCSRSASYLFYPEMFEKLADEFIITTDDGSAGVKGFATDVMKDKI